MMRSTLIAVLTLGCVSAALAEWRGSTGIDPMTDHKSASAQAPFGPSRQPTVVFKCWDHGGILLGIVTGFYNDTVAYAPTLVTFRVDQHLPLKLVATAKNIDGLLALNVRSDEAVALLPLLAQIRDAKSRIALSVGDALFQSDVQGAAQAVSKMFALCGLKEPAAD